MTARNESFGAAALLLSPHVTFNIDGAHVIVEGPAATCRLGCRDPNALQETLLAFAAAATLHDAAASRFDVLQLQPAISTLVDHGMLVDLEALHSAACAEDWLDIYFSICDDWAGDIFRSDFWCCVLQGSASDALILDWVKEFYHRTVGADEHNELSARHCRSPFIKAALTAHFLEERGHGEIMLRGLTACGLLRAEVTTSKPLPTTRALIGYMNRLAVEDSLAYLGCYGILHSPRYGQTRERVQAQFARLAALYPSAAPAITAIREHALLDLSLGHEQIELARYLRVSGVPRPAESTRIIRAAHGMTCVFADFFAGIWGRHAAQAMHHERTGSDNTA